MSWDRVFEGEDILETRAEAAVRGLILDGSMSAAAARETLESCARLRAKPFYSRLEFVRCVAALAASFPEEVSRRHPGSKVGGTVRQRLWHACSPDGVEWLFNYTRFLHGLTPSERLLLPRGTTANEALHAQLNACYARTQALHASSMETRLAFFRAAKVLCLNCLVQGYLGPG